MSNQIKVINNEQSLVDLLSKHEKKHKRYIRYFDDSLKDMYDHNFYCPLTNVDEALIKEIEEEKAKYGYSHIKIHCMKEEPFLKEHGFDQEILLTMLKNDINLEILNKKIIFKNLLIDDIEKDLLEFELLNYGKEYGADFTIRKMNRYFDACKENKGLNFFAAYLDDKMVCSCYTFYDKKVVALDGLVTREDYRHQKIATSLIAFVQQYYHCPIYLHADEDETPKEMYKSLGFNTIYRCFDYLKVDKKV